MAERHYLFPSTIGCFQPPQKCPPFKSKVAGFSSTPQLHLSMANNSRCEEFLLVVHLGIYRESRLQVLNHCMARGLQVEEAC
jgi:hypothetical protein